MTYSINGRQYVAVCAGSSLLCTRCGSNFALTAVRRSLGNHIVLSIPVLYVS